MNPRRDWILASLALLAAAGILGLHVYHLETRLASLEASTRQRGTTAPHAAAVDPGNTAPPEAGPPRAGSSQATALAPSRRTLSLDERAARQVAQGLGGELGLEQERVERLTRFLLAYHLRAALESARARGEDVSEPAGPSELLRGDLKQELLALRLSPAQLATLSRETPGLEALLTR